MHLMPPSFFMFGYARALNRVATGGDPPGLLLRLRDQRQVCDECGPSILDDEVSPSRVFASAFEALQWSVALSDLLDAQWTSRHGSPWREFEPGGAVLNGLRYVRNRFHHQWANAFALARPLDAMKRTDAHLILWRQQLPEPKARFSDPDGRVAYREHLAGRSVHLTLSEAAPAFAHAVVRLESREPDRALLAYLQVEPPRFEPDGLAEAA